MQLLGLVQTPVAHIFFFLFVHFLQKRVAMYLSQKSSCYEPKTVVYAELILHHVVLDNTERQIPIFHFDEI